MNTEQNMKQAIKKLAAEIGEKGIPISYSSPPPMKNPLLKPLPTL